ncbi:ABC transporter ATP-binding protein [Streptomyces sp. E11-3]|uniref:ABC transporter ATP-binding protein n=1 Tax=Streptomyces sp. E11-3 TaxID=3110112 RepID=UPI00397F2B6D
MRTPEAPALAAPRRTTSEALRLVSVRKVHGAGADQVTALDGVTLGLQRGSFTAVMGPSGSGKSTLLRCAAGLSRPTSGLVQLDGAELGGAAEQELALLRRDRIGFVFQTHNLLPTLTVLQNVTLPQRLAGRKPDRARAVEILERVGLGEHLNRMPAQLSGGQQQRVAIARALITRPSVILADEPTGALDSASAREVLTLLRTAVRDHGQTVVMVTHDPAAAACADSVVFLADGRVVGELRDPSADAVAERLAHIGDGDRDGDRDSGRDGAATATATAAGSADPVGRTDLQESGPFGRPALGAA